jgi:hypothetical protein
MHVFLCPLQLVNQTFNSLNSVYILIELNTVTLLLKEKVNYVFLSYRFSIVAVLLAISSRMCQQTTPGQSPNYIRGTLTEVEPSSDGRYHRGLITVSRFQTWWSALKKAIQTTSPLIRSVLEQDSSDFV